MRVKQVSLFLENRPGRLKEALEALASAEVDIRTLSIAESLDFGVVRMILGDTERGVSALRQADFTASVVDVTNTSATFEVPVHALASAEINDERLASYVRLRSPRDAERDIARLADLAAPPKVTITPSWLPRAYRVQIVVETNATPTSSSGAQR